MAKLLISKGADVNAKADRLRTPLHLAALNDRTDVVEILLAGGANVKAKDRAEIVKTEKKTDWGELLIDAVSAGLSPYGVMAPWLYEKKDYTETTTKWGKVDHRTALHYAAEKGNIHIVQLLISKGADVNAKDKDGLTPLALAIKQGHDDAAELLQKHGGKE